MGETVIVRWTNANGAQSLQLLRERLERTYQASMLGRWGVQCRVYHAASGVVTTSDLSVNPSSNTSAISTTTITTANTNTAGVANVATTATGTAVGSTANAASTVSAAANTSTTATATAATPNTTATSTPVLSSTSASAIGTPTTTTTGTPVPLYVIQSTAWPNQVHAVMSGRVVVSAGRELEAILVKLRALWTLRQTAVIEGTTYAMGDLLLRAGSLTVGQAHRGLIVELEYMASRTPGRCQPALKVLLGDLLPPNAIWHTLSPDELPMANCLFTNTNTDAIPCYDTRSPPIIQWETLGLSTTLCSSAHTAYQCARLLQQDRLL
ncbi:TATA-binding related factor of subunit 20 of mediator complex-domain-containing protein [Syncephalis fuscata]|nr:TATA-binding related factor of subunit 20 of mediator complex-domain-containing protein [Syncephalis fuscata]